MHTKLWCPRCASFCTPEEVDFESIPVRCVQCGTAVEVDDRKPEAEALSKRRRIPVPDHFSVESDGYLLRISYPLHGFYGTDVRILLAMALVCTLVSLSALPFDLNARGVICFLFPILIPVAIGGMVLFIWFGKLSGNLIRMVITVGGGRLEIGNSLLPWLGSKLIDTDHIHKLYTTTGGRVTGRHSKLTVYQTYQLWAIVHGDKRIHLLDGLGTLHEAAYLEQVIEEHLLIADRPVPGGISL